MQFYHEVDKKAFPVQNGSKWLCGHFKHVVKGLLVDIYIFVDVNVMLLLIACGCLRVVLNVKKSFLHIFCDVQNLYTTKYLNKNQSNQIEWKKEKLTSGNLLSMSISFSFPTSQGLFFPPSLSLHRKHRC